MDESITVETELFEHEKVKPHFINPCCFGDDFATWLKAELLRVPNSRFNLSDIVQEDYGWGFWAFRDRDRFWIAISYAGNGPQESGAQWRVSVTNDPGFNLVKRFLHKPNREALTELRGRIRKILESNSAIKSIKA